VWTTFRLNTTKNQIWPPQSRNSSLEKHIRKLATLSLKKGPPYQNFKILNTYNLKMSGITTEFTASIFL
jgi:hypothetical protein